MTRLDVALTFVALIVSLSVSLAAFAFVVAMLLAAATIETIAN